MEYITIQGCGGTTKTVDKGISIGQRFAKILFSTQRSLFPLKHLILGMACGGSDPTSGIVANPAIGII